MKGQLQLRIEEIKAEINAGKRNYEFVCRFAAEWNVSTRTVERVLQKAQEQVEEAQQEEEEARREARRVHQAEIEEQRIKNELEIDAALMSIINRKARMKKIIYSMGAAEEREVEPDFKDMIRAADVYYKRQGRREELPENKWEDPNRVTGLKFPGEEELDEELERELMGEGLAEEQVVPARTERPPAIRLPFGHISSSVLR